MNTKPSLCPCGGGDYAACCGRYHGGTSAPDAAALMRSRYSAYVIKLERYLLDTWHPRTCPVDLDLAWVKTKWLALEVRRYSLESELCATVEFVVRYKIGGRARRMHEISRFVREDGRWLYVDGEFLE